MDVEVLAHRGLWSRAEEQNTLPALQQALERGFGIETDVRDHHGRLVISHDPVSETCAEFADVCAEYVGLQSTATLAVNIKSDGLADMLQQTLVAFEIQNYFVFDMSVPDAVQYCKRRLKLFARQSDLEPSICLYQQCAGVWLDAFGSDWYDEAGILEHLNAGKDVCVVSPELHGRTCEAVWKRLRNIPQPPDRRLMLCTDFPEQFTGS